MRICGIVLWVFMLVFMAYNVAAKEYNETLVATIVKVYDGDTIVVDIKEVPPIFGDNISVRLRGIDTPEMKGKCDQEKELAIKAREIVVQNLPIGSTILLTRIGRDKFFRIDASIVLGDGKDLSQLLIDNQLAYPYNGETKKSWCNGVIPVEDVFK